MITERGEVVCDGCQKPLVVGEHPWCPHGFPLTGLKQLGDEINEWHEHLGHAPVHLTSRIEKKRLLKELNLTEFVRHMPSETGPKIARWV